MTGASDSVVTSRERDEAHQLPSGLFSVPANLTPMYLRHYFSQQIAEGRLLDDI